MRKLGAVLIIVCLSGAAALSLASCGSSSGGGKEGGTLTVNYASFPDYMDPQLSYTSEGWTAMYNTYIPLLTYKHADAPEGNEVIPGLAEALPKVSKDGKTYTLMLRKGLKYSNGEPVKAGDFKFAVERMFKLNSGGTPSYTDIVGAAKFAKTKTGEIAGIQTDDKTGKITIHLERPSGTFTYELGLLFVAPVPQSTPEKDQSASPPPATGPYMITSSKPGREWKYARNPEWKKTNEALMPELPSGHVDKIEVEVVSNQATQVNDVEQNKTNFMFDPIPSDRVAEVSQRYEGTQFKTEPTISTYYFWMNTKKAPFNDLKIREAVNYAVDPAALERIYSGQIEGTHQIIPPRMAGYKKFDLYPPNLAKAKQMIKEANPSDRDITVWTDDVSPNDDAGSYYQDLLQKIGFNAKLKIINADNYFTVIGNQKTPDLDTGWADWYADYPAAINYFQPTLTSEAILPENNSNWANLAVPSLDKKVNQLATEEVGPKQEGELQELDKEFMEEAPWAPYGNRLLSTFVDNEIELEKIIFSPSFSQDFTSFQFK